jgi:UDP-N-acetylmuramoyl-L-alanyl-D-glutamate--2,6-diaminopimelate ligase
MRLFDEVLPAGGKAIVWLDESEWTERALGHVKKRGLELLTVGPGGSALDLVECRPTRFGQELVLRHAGGEERVPLPLIGGYQAANAMISATLAMATGSDRDAVLDAMSRLQPVRGRLERAVITRAGAPVYVDFAHTPDAVAAALSALRPHAKGRLIAVVSAGGDRDHGKRTPIGAAAAQGADLVIVTDDNPRGEDPAVIRAAVLEGAPGAREIGDRRAGIAAAIDCASKEDIVLVTGKGHEQFQIIGSGQDLRKVPFDDVTVARECAAALGEDR